MATKFMVACVCLLVILATAPAALATRPSTPITVEVNISHAPRVGEWATVVVTVTSITDAPNTQLQLFAPGGVVAPAGPLTLNLQAGIPEIVKGSVHFLQSGNREVRARAMSVQSSGAVWGDVKSVPVFVAGGKAGQSQIGWKVASVPVAVQVEPGDTPIASMEPTAFSFSEELVSAPEQAIPSAVPLKPQPGGVSLAPKRPISATPAIPVDAGRRSRLRAIPLKSAQPSESPGTVTLTGTWRYTDRSGIQRVADQQLIEVRGGDGSALNPRPYCFTNTTGTYSCAFAYPGTTSFRVWLRSWTNYNVTGGTNRLGVFSGTEVSGGCGSDSIDCTYPVQTGAVSCADGATCNVGTWNAMSGEPWAGAMQMTQDLIRSWKRLAFDTKHGTGKDVAGPGRINYPVPASHGTHAHVPPADGWISIEPPSQEAGDIVVHEYGHVVMANLWATFTPTWPTSDCPSPHYIQSVGGPGCALYEGWGDYWAWYSNQYYDGDNTTSNNGPVFNWGPDVGGTNMETRDGGTYQLGDQVEGNVAAAFGDLYDSTNETPASGPADKISDGIQHIWHVISSQSDYNFSQWWTAYVGYSDHSRCPELDALWLNTIEYTPACPPAPVNDDYADAMNILSTPYGHVVNISSATTEAADPAPSCGNSSRSKSVWYRFVPSWDGTVTADTIGSGYDTILASFTGGPGTFVQKACSDDYSATPQSRIQFSVTAGTPYSLMATAYWPSNLGTLDFSLSLAVPMVTLTPPSVMFNAQTVGVASSPKPVVLTNSGAAPLTITSVGAAVGGNSTDFSRTHNCPLSPSTIAVGASCTIQVTFTPTAIGPRKSSVVVVDNAIGSPRTIILTGLGR